MNRFGSFDNEATELRGAWQDWRLLEKKAQAFLEIPHVARALSDDEYRLRDFTSLWRKQPKGTGADDLSQKKNGSRFDTYVDVAAAYYRAANNTQKWLDRKNSPVGMRSMTFIMEKMNLLLKGSTLHSECETVDFIPVPKTAETIEGLRIHAILALKVLLSATRGDLDSAKPDTLVTESHALHVVTTHQSNHIQRRIPRVNQMATLDNLEQGYGYGRVNGKELFDRIQGSRFRAIQLHEQAEEILPDIASAQKYILPANAVRTLLMSEVCTAKALATKRPTFFEGQWGIGPVASAGRSVDFSRDNIREQLLMAIPFIAETILHYPTDNPLIKNS